MISFGKKTKRVVLFILPRYHVRHNFFFSFPKQDMKRFTIEFHHIYNDDMQKKKKKKTRKKKVKHIFSTCGLR
jgi:hypothetical protein